MIPAMMVAFLLICNTMTMATNPWNENDKEVPWFGEILPPEPFIGFYSKVAQCLWNVKPVCGLQIYTHIFHRSKKLDDNCCRNVVKVGVRCSRALGWALSLYKKFKPHKALIDKMSITTYYECVGRKL